MKLKYEKPVVAIDRYELSQSIAGCDVKIGSADSMCFMLDSDVPNATKDFAAAGHFVTGCNIPAREGQDYDGLCYHTQVNAALLS